MKKVMVVLASLTMFLGSGALMAMDSEYMEKRRKQISETAESNVSQLSEARQENRLDLVGSVRDEGDGVVSAFGDKTREALRHWWL
ncbi:hypothetical protein RAN53_01565 [Halomonas sp. SSL-5]|uniref:hypothetical protein n=1 Tax=Halomonas sp. SSL-5 TaxID=3065855 RepID=UPI00273856A2|nr:hypothetical protein [Halomonas sp. SSL-5]MDY7115027.1 hypothetical protein [Halomonas sp. SSL-5]